MTAPSVSSGVSVAAVLEELMDVRLFSLEPGGFVVGEWEEAFKQLKGCLEDSLD